MTTITSTTPSTTTTPVGPAVTLPVTTPSTGPTTPADTTTTATGNFFSRLFGSSSTATTATTEPVTTPVTTPVVTPTPVATTVTNPIDVALNSLVESQVDKLWKETVTDGSTILAVITLGISSLINRCIYLSKKSAAVEADKTVDAFKQASIDLVNAVAARNLTNLESSNSNRVRFRDADVADNATALNAEAEAKTTAFYEAFKARISLLNVNVNSTNYAFYAAAAQQQIVNVGAKLKTDLTNGVSFKTPLITKIEDGAKLNRMATNLTPKLETTKQAFNHRLFNDMANAFAAQPLEDITIESLKAKIDLIKVTFPGVLNNDPLQGPATINIETLLRQAIKAGHTSEAIDTLRGQFAAPEADSARMQEIIEALTAAQTGERDTLIAELNAMRGPNGYDGTYNAAVQAKEQAEAEMIAARNAYFVQAQTLVPSNALTNAELLALFVTPSSTTAVEAAKQDFIRKAQAFNAAVEALGTIQARFAEIAVYTGAEITGGRLFEINQNLDPVHLAAQARIQATKTAEFYDEINAVVGETNKIVRSRALNRLFE